jgi:hypothetical protein
MYNDMLYDMKEGQKVKLQQLYDAAMLLEE